VLINDSRLGQVLKMMEKVETEFVMEKVETEFVSNLYA
jgi:hypothetical protein